MLLRLCWLLVTLHAVRGTDYFMIQSPLFGGGCKASDHGDSYDGQSTDPGWNMKHDGGLRAVSGNPHTPNDDELYYLEDASIQGFPGFAVKMIKGKDYFTSRAPSIVDGSHWAKESKWNGA